MISMEATLTRVKVAARPAQVSLLVIHQGVQQTTQRDIGGIRQFPRSTRTGMA